MSLRTVRCGRCGEPYLRPVAGDTGCPTCRPAVRVEPGQIGLFGRPPKPAPPAREPLGWSTDETADGHAVLLDTAVLALEPDEDGAIRAAAERLEATAAAMRRYLARRKAAARREET